MKILISTILIISFINEISSQDFEGIIIYERRSNTNKIAIEKYYFGNNKLRIDSDFVNNSIDLYSNIYDFTKTPNLYYSSNSCGKYSSYEIRIEYLDTIHHKNDATTESILTYPCSELELEFNEGDFGTIPKQKRLVANELTFTVPKDWIMEYHMVLTKDNRITLYLEEEIMNTYHSREAPSGYSRMALAVIPMKLPDSIFDVNN